MRKLKKTRLTVERLMAQLRSESIRHLGEVKRLYFEAKGTFTLVRKQEAKPGLSILPHFDKAFLREQQQDQKQVCGTCGAEAPAGNLADTKCPNCGENHWEPAIR